MSTLRGWIKWFLGMLLGIRAGWDDGFYHLVMAIPYIGLALLMMGIGTLLAIGLPNYRYWRNNQTGRLGDHLRNLTWRKRLIKESQEEMAQPAQLAIFYGFLMLIGGQWIIFQLYNHPWLIPLWIAFHYLMNREPWWGIAVLSAFAGEEVDEHMKGQIMPHFNALMIVISLLAMSLIFWLYFPGA